MRRHFYAIAALMLCFNCANGQHLSVADLTRLLGLSAKESAEFLTQAQFKLISAKTRYADTKSVYSSTVPPKNESVIITRYTDSTSNREIKYLVEPDAYVRLLRKQLRQAGYRLKAAPENASCRCWNYFNKVYTFFIEKRDEILPASITVTKGELTQVVIND